MKKLTLSLTAVVFFIGGAMVHSQVAPAQKTPLQILQAAKAFNDDLIEQQKKTIAALEEMQKNAEQIKVLGKRG
jgi:hypothetical protein